MAREPVTRMQLDAYRFGQRRLESALARRDPALLHEEIRGQRRVVVTGLALAMLLLAGTFAYAKAAGKPAWNHREVVVGKQSGRMFAVIHNPDRLVPVANLAAARLVLAASDQHHVGAPRTPMPTHVDDAALQRAPRTATAAVPGAAVALPAAGDLPAPVGSWAVCDSLESTLSTTVVADATAPKPLPDSGALLLRSSENELYLVVSGRRYRIDDDAVLRAYNLVDDRSRPVSDAVLGAIPEGRALGMPTIRGAGKAGPGGLPAQVGDVVRVPADTGDRFYLVAATGVQEISAPVANLIRTQSRFDLSRPAPAVRAELINALPRTTVDGGLDDYPRIVPTVAKGPGASTVCWQWGSDGTGGSVTVDQSLPVPAGRSTTELAQADGAKPNLDAVSMPHGPATVVRAVSGRGAGGLWLVSETGIGHPIAAGQHGSSETALALGIEPDSASPAPEQALRLLPAGPALDLALARRTVDVLVGPARN